MSLLQQNAPNPKDPSARGDDLASGSGYIVWSAIAAIVVVSVAITLYVLAGQKPPVAAGEVVRVWAHPMESRSRPPASEGTQGETETFDQVLVFAQLRLRDQGSIPLFLHDLRIDVDFPDGPHTASAIGETDYNRLFIAYPELSGLRSKCLSREATIQPGQTMDGMVVGVFHVDKRTWAARKNLGFAVDFQYQKTLNLVPTGEVTEQ